MMGAWEWELRRAGEICEREGGRRRLGGVWCVGDEMRWGRCENGWSLFFEKMGCWDEGGVVIFVVSIIIVDRFEIISDVCQCFLLELKKRKSIVCYTSWDFWDGMSFLRKLALRNFLLLHVLCRNTRHIVLVSLCDLEVIHVLSIHSLHLSELVPFNSDSETPFHKDLEGSDCSSSPII